MGGYAEYVVEDLLNGLEGVKAKRMFGGYGLSLSGTICGLIADEVLYFKADGSNRGEFEKRGSRPFTYETSRGKRAVMSYWEVPADILEDRAELEAWVHRSAAVSVAAAKMGAKRKRI